MKTLKSEISGDLQYWQKEDIQKNQYHFNIAQNMWNADYREYIKAGNEEEGSMGRNVSLVLNYLPPRARTNGFDLGVYQTNSNFSSSSHRGNLQEVVDVMVFGD